MRSALFVFILVLAAGCSRPASRPQAPASAPQATATAAAQASAPPVAPTPAAVPSPAVAPSAAATAAEAPATPGSAVPTVPPVPSQAQPTPPSAPAQPGLPQQPVTLPTAAPISPLPSPVGPVAGSAADPNELAASIKTRLEQAGFRVLEVRAQPLEGDTPAIVRAVAEAAYAQPSEGAVLSQAYTMWTVMATALAISPEEASRTYIVSGQLWSQYVILVGVPVSAFMTFQQAASVAPDDTGRMEAFRVMAPHLKFAVFDVQANQYVDQQDFVNKNFTR